MHRPRRHFVQGVAAGLVVGTVLLFTHSPSETWPRKETSSPFARLKTSVIISAPENPGGPHTPAALPPAGVPSISAHNPSSAPASRIPIAIRVDATAQSAPVAHSPSQGGDILEEKSEPLSQPGEFLRTQIIKTAGKYPYLRVATRFRIDPATKEETPLGIERSVADHVIVGLQPDATESDLLLAVQALGGTLRKHLRLDGQTGYLVALASPTCRAVPDAIADLSARQDLVRQVEPDMVMRTESFPNDPKWNEQWSLHNTGQRSGRINADIDAPEAWSIQTGSTNVIVAVVDTGVDYNHPDLQKNMWINPRETPDNGQDDDQNGFIDDTRGWDFSDNDPDPMDLAGHGTHVASIIGAAGNNGVGMAGVCWDIRIMPVRVANAAGEAYVSDVLEGFSYAARNGARIINYSLGSTNSSPLMQAAISSLQTAGILLITAAGNDSLDIDQRPTYPSAYSNPNIISVASTDVNDSLSSFSNYGVSRVDLAAPGAQISGATLSNRYDNASGTSFAAPHVTGVAALLLAQNPAWSYSQIRSAILKGVDRLPALVGKCSTGGRLNAYKALSGQSNPDPGSPVLDSTNAPLANNQVSAIAVQADRKILIGGSFSTVNGTARARIARLNPDATLDLSFNPGVGPNGPVYSIASASGGKSLIAGDFTTIGGVSRPRVARLNTDGTVDATFAPGRGASGAIFAMAAQSNGQILIGGSFTNFNLNTRNRVARLNADGTLDSTFDPGDGPDSVVRAILSQSASRVIIAGDFKSVAGTARRGIARLAGSGALDPGFGPSPGTDGPVYALALEPDGRIVLGGEFTMLGQTPLNRLARLNADGSLHPNFEPGAGPNGSVWSLGVQSDGLVLVGGAFTTLDGFSRNRIARLRPGGRPDFSFDTGPGANDHVRAIAVRSDGIVWIGGDFTKVNGASAGRYARLNGGKASMAAPLIRRQPVTKTYGEGQRGVVEVVSEGVPEPACQWFLGTRLLEGATNGSLVFTSVQLSDAGAYSVTVSNTAGFLKSAVATLTILPAPGPALDNAELVWTTGGNLPWLAQTNVSHDGISAAQSGRIGDAAETWLQTTLDGPGLLRYWHRVSSEGGADHLRLTIGTRTASDVSGSVEWAEQTVAIPSGPQVVRWTYAKNATNTAGLDAAWLDQVSFLADLPSITAQPTGQSLAQGASVTLTVTATNTSSYQWLLDGIALPDATNASLTIANAGCESGGAYTVRVGNDLGAITSKPATLTIKPSRLDDRFGSGPGANGSVWALATQPDGRVLLGGDFTTVHSTPRRRVARLQSDGTLDTSFDPGAGADAAVWALALQKDGQALLGGDFTTIDGHARHGIARLSATGAVEPTFSPGLGANASVLTLLLQPDGQIILGGSFTQFNGTTRNHVARLNSDGSLDVNFDPGVGPNATVRSAALQSDGRIWIAGDFTSVGEIARGRVARLGVDGKLDLTFDPGEGANGSILSLALAPDSHGILTGDFTTYAGVTRHRVVRVNPGGDLDLNFDPGSGPDGLVLAVALQPDGKPTIGGAFNSVNGVQASRVARLNANGTPDPSLDPGTGANGWVYSILVQPDGHILLAGSFSAIDGKARGHIARLKSEFLFGVITRAAEGQLQLQVLHDQLSCLYRWQSTADFVHWLDVTNAPGYGGWDMLIRSDAPLQFYRASPAP